MFARLKARFAENARRKALCKGLDRTSVAIDCGANVGKVTEWLACTGARVYAFEPNPFAFAILKERFGQMGNVRLYNSAVYTKRGKLPLFFHRNAVQDQIYWSTGSSLLAEKENVDASQHIEVETVDLADFICELNCFVAIVKIDVEGVECAILNHLLDRGVDRQVGRFVVETHERVAAVAEAVSKLRTRIKDEGIRNIDLGWI